MQTENLVDGAMSWRRRHAFKHPSNPSDVILWATTCQCCQLLGGAFPKAAASPVATRSLPERLPRVRVLASLADGHASV